MRRANWGAVRAVSNREEKLRKTPLKFNTESSLERLESDTEMKTKQNCYGQTQESPKKRESSH